MLRTLLIALVLTGCGEKKPLKTDPNAASQADPKAEFAAGIKLLGGAGGKSDFDGALAKFESATTADPTYTKAWFNGGYAAERTGDLEKAERFYRKAVELKADYAAAVFNLGGVLQAAGKGLDAAEVLKAYVAAHPDDLEARNNLVDALTSAKMYDEAIAEAQEVLARDPKNVGAYRNLSRVPHRPEDRAHQPRGQPESWLRGPQLGRLPAGRQML